jgi:NAD+ synthase (glutamine-hydrolysing)
MKLAICQHNYTIGDIPGNTRKITGCIRDLRQKNVTLAVFSELAICGYPPLDLLERDDFVKHCLAGIAMIAKECTGITAIVGSPSFNTRPTGKRLYNSAFILSGGEIQDVVHKTLLPDYDVFDEYRFFESSPEWKTIKTGKTETAVTICEDIWEEQPWSPDKKLYSKLPLENLSKKPELIINISASPFSYHQHSHRISILKKITQKYDCPVVYVNQTGANTDLVFDGGSTAVSHTGEIVAMLPFFNEAVQIIDTHHMVAMESPASLPGEITLIHDALVTGIGDYFRKSGFKKAVLGLSGGIDSALVAALACEALGAENVTGLLMPSPFSSQHSVDDAKALAENLRMNYRTLPISETFTAFEKTLAEAFEGTEFGIAEENIQARIRGSLLMAWSNKFGNILLNTSNKSEMAVGYGTLYGDMCGALSVLGDVYKTQVYKLAHYMNRDRETIPENTIVKPPSAELRHDQKDSDSLPEYDLLDAILFRYIEKNLPASAIEAEGYDPQTVEKVLRLVNINEYKRYQAPPVIRISPKAFGPGRRMPVVGKIYIS